jgi:beta-galactosidase
MKDRSFTRWIAQAASVLVCLVVGGSAGDEVGTAETQRYRAPTTHRLGKTINREWTFNYFPDPTADGAGCQLPDFNDANWPAVAVPHTWQTYETTGKVHPFIYDASEKDGPYWWRGWGWYRKHFSIGNEQANRKIFVEFDGVQKYSKVWVNGQPVGDHKGGYSGFYFDITDLVRLGQDNVLAVAVNNRQNDPFRIPPMSAGNFDVYGGIYRDVRIVITDRLHIPFQGSYRHQGGTFITTPSVSQDAAEVGIRTWVKNDYPAARQCELHTIIVDAGGIEAQRLTAEKSLQAGELAEFDQTSRPIAQPHLWSPETPYVYTVVSDVCDAGKVVDCFASPLGIRQFHWDFESNRLILNGNKVIIHGSNRHQEYPWLGDATPKWLHLLDMRDFRQNLNQNFMRTAHYPQDPAIYDFCDRHGIIVIEEAPNIKRQKFSDEVQEQQLREMIRRDRNHPSIFFWSMGNETDDAVDSRFAIEEDATRIIHARDIYNDSAGKYVGTTSKQLPLESMLRCTIRGWYNSDVRALEPNSVQQTGTEEWQHDKAAAAFIKLNEGRTPDDRGNLNTWLYEDHGADREYANCPLKHVNPKGFVDCWRTPKYFYYLWQAWYADKPVVFIHPHFWRAQYLGQKKEIVVDSNCDVVELKVNGRSVGTLKPRFEEANVLRFKDVPVEQGALTAEGRKGNQVVTATVVMAGPPAKLTLSADPDRFEAGLDSVAIVHADIVDAQGTHVYGATNTIQWVVSGPATLVGPAVYSTDTGKFESMEGTMCIDAPTFNIIRSTGKPGQIKVRVLSPGLASAEVAITAAVMPVDASTAIVEPPLPRSSRQPVARESGAAKPHQPAPEEMKGVSEDLVLKGRSVEDYARQIDQLLHEASPGLDFNGPEYQAVVGVFARLLQNNGGSLVRDDFNFTVGFYNECRRITRRIAPLNVPGPYKQALRQFYSHRMIEQGQASDLDAETRWLDSLPDGRLIVPGDEPNLTAMVSSALPEFEKVSDARRLALLDVVCAINPWIERRVIRRGGESVDGVRQKTTEVVSYEMPKGTPTLVPDMEYLQLHAIKTDTGAQDTIAPAGTSREERWRKQIGDNFFVPDPLPSLDAGMHRRFTLAPGVQAEAVTYRTQLGLLVPAILYLPDPMPAGRIPAFIVVNGHGGDKYSWYSYYTGVLFARGGAAVLTYDQIGEGERNRLHKSGSRAHDSIKGDAVLARHLAGLMITDVRQAVSYLSQRPEVDQRRIGAGGYSMGSFVLALAGAVEPRLHACVLVGGGNLDGPDGYWDSSNKLMCQALPYQSLRFLGDRPAVIYALHASRGPTLIFNGPSDTVVSMPKYGEPFFADLRNRVVQLHGGPAGVFEAGFASPDAGHRPYFVTRPVVQWLEKQIDFPNWTDQAIRSMPETKIGDWAKRTGVPLDKLYATEDREGGTLALGDDIPGYAPDSLNVLPLKEWESRKKDFILETWLGAVEKTISSFGS